MKEINLKNFAILFAVILNEIKFYLNLIKMD